MSEDLLMRYKKALEGLTVGGSEYYNEPERCARDVRNKLDRQHERIKRLIKERNRILRIPVIGWIVRKIIY